ncbi:MAG TPA: GAF domain-containing protein [Burkholderiaceae bacterium]|nr:GAF domain-containing protein [Burkholderiaceae bacterium]
MNFEPKAIERVADVTWIAELYRVSGVAALSSDPHDALLVILNHIVDGFGAVSGSLALVPDGESDVLELVAAIDVPPHAFGTRIAFGSHVFGKVAQEQEPRLMQGESSEHRASERTRARASSMCWPLVVRDRTVGTLAVNRALGQPTYTELDLEHGQIMANVVALVVENARVHRDQQSRIEALSRMNAALTEAHRQLTDAQEQLVQSEKMASIGQFATELAGEINHPVACIDGNVDLMEQCARQLLGVLDAYAAATTAASPALEKELAKVDLQRLRGEVHALLAESRASLGRVRKIVQDLKSYSQQ